MCDKVWNEQERKTKMRKHPRGFYSWMTPPDYVRKQSKSLLLTGYFLVVASFGGISCPQFLRLERTRFNVDPFLTQNLTHCYILINQSSVKFHVIFTCSQSPHNSFGILVSFFHLYITGKHLS